MAELNHNSTISELRESFQRNASYEEDGSVAKAKAFITACRILLAKPQRGRKGGGSAATEYEFNHEQIRLLMRDARAYVAANSPDFSSVTDVDFTDFDRRT